MIGPKTHWITPVFIFFSLVIRSPKTDVNTRCNHSLCKMISKFNVFCRLHVSTFRKHHGWKVQTRLWGEGKWTTQELNKKTHPHFWLWKYRLWVFRRSERKNSIRHDSTVVFTKKKLIKTHLTHTHTHTHAHTHARASPENSSCRAPWRIKAGIKGHGAPVKYSAVSAGSGNSRACVSCTRTQKSKPRDSVPEPCTEKVSDTY